HGILRSMVEEAIRSLPLDTAASALAPVEAAAASMAVSIEQAAQYPLLLAPARRTILGALEAALQGHPPDDDAMEALRANLYAEQLLPELSLAQEACRLARFLKAVGTDVPQDVMGWSRLMRDQVAWADWSLRRFRRRLAAVSPALQATAGPLLDDLLARRDALNAAFASTLQASWRDASTNRDLRELLPLSQLSRCLIRPLVDDGHRVFLVVLDGCDLSTFIEMISTAPQTSGLGLTLPEIHNPTLRGDLSAAGAFQVSLALLPTVTSHSRRAIFAGEIPKNPTLTDTEAAAANASNDKTALRRNTALGDLTRVLFLKGDLQDDALDTALRSDEHRIVAVVYNGVDDALSSNQTTPMDPWKLDALGDGALQSLQTAAAEGWTILVTSDHGHTPHLGSDRKRAAKAMSARYHSEPLPGAVRFDLPNGPMYLLCEPGAWFGHQHRGHHGGVGLEEVFVPLAFIGPVSDGSGRPEAPTWWSRILPAASPPPTSPEPPPQPVVAPPPPVKPPPPVTPPPPVAPPAPTPPAPSSDAPATAPAWAAELPDDPTRRIFVHIVNHGCITEAEATTLLGSPTKFRKFNRRFEDNASRVPFRTRVVQTGAGKRYEYLG
ncbi:MAG: hypothetical protein ACI8RZ_006517, partial [Myxococcota bacterium]